MKRSNKILILLFVLVIICGVTYGVKRYEEHQEDIKNSDEIIVSLDRDLVNSVSWKTEEYDLSFTKKETWSYDGDAAFPVDEDKMNRLLDTFSEFGASFRIDDVENTGMYGLDDPICTIVISTADQDTYSILLGDYSKMDSQRYVSIGDGKVYLVKSDPYDLFNIGLEEMIKDDEIPDFEKADAIRFHGSTEYGIIYDEEGKNSYLEGDVYFTEDTELPLDTSLVESYLGSISSLYLDTYATYNATEEELAAFGLDAPDLTVEVDYTQEEDSAEKKDTFSICLSLDPEDKAAWEDNNGENAESESDAEELHAYLRIGESRIIYDLSGNDYETLMRAGYNDLRHQDLFYGDFSHVNQLDFTLEDKTYTITCMNEDDGTYTYYYGDETIDPTDIRSSIRALSAAEFTEETSAGKEEIRITLHLDHEAFPEVEIILYRYDGDYCLAAVNGDIAAKVSRTAVVDVMESINKIVLAAPEGTVAE